MNPAPGLPVAALLLCLAAGAMPNAAFSFVLPMQLQRLALPPTTAGVLGIAYSYGLILGLLPMAALAGRYRPRRVLLPALFCAAAFSLALALPLDTVFLIGLRGLQGAAAAGVFVSGLALVRPVFGADRLGLGFGLATAAGTVGIVLLNLVFGIGYTWLGVLGVVVPAMLVVFAALPLGWAGLPDTAAVAGRGNVLGAVLNLLCFGFLLAALTMVAFSPWWAALLLLFGLFTLAVWVWQQSGQVAPLLPLDLLAWPQCRRAVGAAFLLGLSLGAVSVFGFQHLIAIWRMPQGWLGTVAFTTSVVPAIAAVLGGLAAGRAVPWRPGLVGGILFAVGAGLLLRPWAAGEYAAVVGLVLMGVIGVGRGLLDLGNTLVLVGGAPVERATAAAGLLVLAGSVGGLLAPLITVLPQLWSRYGPTEGGLGVTAIGLGLAGVAALGAAWLNSLAARQA